MMKIGKYVRGVLLAINILFLLVLVFGHYFISRFPPGDYFPLGLIGLAYPLLVLAVVGFTLLWLFFYYKYALFGIVAIVLCWGSISVIFALHTSSKEITSAARQSSIRIMSYNVHYFKDFSKSKTANVQLRNKIIDLIEKKGPDILCLQEFYTSENPNDSDNKTLISNELNLPHRYFSSDHNYKNNHSGVILFSRFPILKAGKIHLIGNNSKEIAIYADIEKGEDTVRVFTTHLRSIYLTDKDMQRIEDIKNQKRDTTNLKATKKIVRKLRTAFRIRGKEVDLLSQRMKESPYPVIICGDFNDPPNSYTYFTLSEGLKDAFLEKGFGLGRTFSGISPTLRIDYILADPSFDILSYQRFRKDLSDHYPIIADIKL